MTYLNKNYSPLKNLKKHLKMNRLFKSSSKEVITSLIIILSLTISTHAINSKKTFNEEGVRVVYVIDNETEKLSNIVLYKVFKSDDIEVIFEKYKNCSFLTGYLKGEYKEEDGQIMVARGSSLIIIKDKDASLFDKPAPVFIDIPKEERYTGKFEFLYSEEFLPGDMFIILFNGKYGYGRPPMPFDELKVEIIKNDKNQTVLKVL